jgi:tRNA(fMet)-specific endonuclease VapC
MMGGWLAEIRPERNISRQGAVDRRLADPLVLFSAGHVERFDDAAVDAFLRLSSSRLRIGTQDPKIAAIAIARDARLLSANLRDFRRVSGVRVENRLE